MKLAETSIRNVFSHSFKKLILESVSVKFWAAVFIGYLNYYIITTQNKFDPFGMMMFCLTLGIRETADFLQQYQKGEIK